MESYDQMQKRHQAEFNAFPMAFAFSNAQFDAGMRKLGLDPADTDKVYAYGDTGGFYRRSDAPLLREMRDRHKKERQEAMTAEGAGENYIFEMFRSALAAHEYGYTQDADDALDSLGLTIEAINADPKMKCAFELACSVQKCCCDR